MTPDQQRTALALACPERIRQVNERWQYFDGTYWLDCRQNDPLTDLNAMHEAEKVLIEHPGLYWFSLAKVVGGSLKDIACATASQRVEAFLRTLNL